MSDRGRFIVVEGLEGAGKSTAVATIAQYLTTHQKPFILTREPGGTPISEALRTLIKQHHDMSHQTELLLLYAARMQLLETVVWPALVRGEWVISDRFELSTLAYQGAGRGIDPTLIAQISKLTLKGFQPDYTFFLDIAPAEGLARAASRAKMTATTLDRIEQEPLDFFNAVSRGYHEAIQNMQSAGTHVCLIDASQSLEHVQADLLRALYRDIGI